MGHHGSSWVIMGHHGSSLCGCVPIWIVPKRHRKWVGIGIPPWHRDGNSLNSLLSFQIWPVYACVMVSHRNLPFWNHFDCTRSSRNIELTGLDASRSAALFLRRVHRPLEPSDFLAAESLSEAPLMVLSRFVETRNIRNASKNNEKMKITSVIQCNPV